MSEERKTLDEMTLKDARAHLENGGLFKYTTPGGTEIYAGRVPWTNNGYALSYENTDGVNTDGGVQGAYTYVQLMQGMDEAVGGAGSLEKWEIV